MMSTKDINKQRGIRASNFFFVGGPPALSSTPLVHTTPKSRMPGAKGDRLLRAATTFYAPPAEEPKPLDASAFESVRTSMGGRKHSIAFA